MKTHRTSPSLLFAAMLVAAPFHADAARIDYQVDLGLERNDNVLMSSTDPADSSALRAGFGFVVTEETSAVQANFSGRFEYWNYVDGPQPSNAFERSEEHTSELQSLMRISYAVFCLKKHKHKITVT